MSRIVDLAVCFADVCDSTALFEKHGDDKSREVIGKTLSLISKVVEDHNGTVVKTIGDEVMGTFPDLVEATSAVSKLPSAVKEDESLSTFGIRIRVGMCYGSVVQDESEDVFGDAVNTASRLVDWARADQVITTVQTVNCLPEYFQGRTRSLGETNFKGKEETVEIVELLGEKDESNLTVVIQDQTSDQQEDKKTIVITYQGKRVEVERGPVVFGRGTKSDFTIPDSRVSRVHSVIERERDSFVVNDNSTNGTYIKIGNEDPIFLHHEQLRLRGKGHMSFGRPFSDEDAKLLTFKCTSSSTERSSLG